MLLNIKHEVHLHRVIGVKDTKFSNGLGNFPIYRWSFAWLLSRLILMPFLHMPNANNEIMGHLLGDADLLKEVQSSINGRGVGIF